MTKNILMTRESLKEKILKSIKANSTFYLYSLIFEQHTVTKSIQAGELLNANSFDFVFNELTLNIKHIIFYKEVKAIQFNADQIHFVIE